MVILWIESYLTGRKQATKFLGIKSIFLSIKFGVPHTPENKSFYSHLMGLKIKRKVKFENKQLLKAWQQNLLQILQLSLVKLP